MDIVCIPLPSRSHSTPSKDSHPRRTRLSRTLSDTPSSDSNTDLETDSPHTPLRLDAPLSPVLNRGAEQSTTRPTIDPLLLQASPPSLEVSPFPNRKASPRNDNEDEDDGALEQSYYYSFHSHSGNTSQTELEGKALPLAKTSTLDNEPPATPMADGRSNPGCRTPGQEGLSEGRAASRGSGDGRGLPRVGDKDRTVVPMTLYQHRVKGLVLALLVEPHLQRDTEAMEEVVSG